MHYLCILVIALVMIAGGVGHLMAPSYFAAFVPANWPVQPILVGTGVLQILIGLGALWPRTRAAASLAFVLLCAAYLPLHAWDFFRPDPVFKPASAAAVRLVVQFVFIGIGLALWRHRTTPRTGAPA